MSTAAIGARAAAAVGSAQLPETAGVQTQAGVLRSEWTKLRSLRSTMWTLLVAVALTIGFGALVSGVSASQYDTDSPAERAIFSAVSTSLSGFTIAQLAFGVLGVLVITGEYSTGMIHSSLTAVPRRLPVLWGKMVVYATTTFIISLAASAVSFFVGQALLSSTGVAASIGDPGALRSVVGAALYVTVAGLIGLALGTIVRNTAAGISVFVSVFFVIPPLMGLLPKSFADSVTPYLPSNAGEALYSSVRTTNQQLAPWTGFAVLCAYAVVLIAVAAWELKRRDA